MLKIVILVPTDVGLVSQVHECGHDDVERACKQLDASTLGVGLVTGAVVARSRSLLDNVVTALAAAGMPALEGADPTGAAEGWDYSLPTAEAAYAE